MLVPAADETGRVGTEAHRRGADRREGRPQCKDNRVRQVSRCAPSLLGRQIDRRYAQTYDPSYPSTSLTRFPLPRYDSTRQTGAMVCAGSATMATVFVIGLLKRSYWILAIPVIGGVLIFILVAIWV